MVDNIFLDNSNNKLFFFKSDYFFKNFFFKSVLNIRYGCFYSFFIFYFLFNFLFGFFPFSYKVRLKELDLTGGSDGSYFKIIFYYNAPVRSSLLSSFKYNFSFVFLSNFKTEDYSGSFTAMCNLRLGQKFFYINFFNMWDFFYANSLSSIKSYFAAGDTILCFYLTLDSNSSFVFNNFIKKIEAP